MPTAHAKDFRPSSAATWMECPASIQMSREYPQDDVGTEYQWWGSAAHCLGYNLLAKLNYKLPPDPVYLIDKDEIVRGSDPQLATERYISVDAEMEECAEEYAAYVKSIPGVVEALYEEQVDFSHWVPEGFGTGDAVLLDKDGVLHVIDLKGGKGVQVYAPENPQLLCYALGALRLFDLLYDIKEIRLHVVQPRLGHFDDWSCDLDYLLEFGERAKQAAANALGCDPLFNPGEKQCRWCPAKAHCPALAEFSLAQAQKTFAPFAEVLASEQPVETKVVEPLSSADVAALMKHIPLIEDWCRAVFARAKDILLTTNNTGLPGYKLVEGRSQRKWASEHTVVTALSDAARQLGLDDDAIFTKKLVSPAQAEKLLGKKHPLLAEHVVKPAGNPTLVAETDKREPLKMATAQDVFGEADSNG